MCKKKIFKDKIIVCPLYCNSKISMLLLPKKCVVLFLDGHHPVLHVISLLLVYISWLSKYNFNVCAFNVCVYRQLFKTVFIILFSFMLYYYSYCYMLQKRNCVRKKNMIHLILLTLWLKKYGCSSVIVLHTLFIFAKTYVNLPVIVDQFWMV